MAPSSYPLAVRVVAGLVILALLVVFLLWWKRPALTEEEIRRAVVTTIQSEAQASFFVTGVLRITAESTVENTEYLLPQSFRLNLGTTQARVRMPGHVSYGFDVRSLRPEAIRLTDDGIVEVTLPDLSPYSVETDVGAMEIHTSSTGWQRWTLTDEEREAIVGQALQSAQAALRKQAAEHLETATQPRINTAEALQLLLKPVLQAAGMSDPQFRFQIGPRIVMDG